MRYIDYLISRPIFSMRFHFRRLNGKNGSRSTTRPGGFSYVFMFSKHTPKQPIVYPPLPSDTLRAILRNHPTKGLSAAAMD